jgi:DNA-binding winged helix-turn-helix (wHTH) protein/tetratricopeptide (TPR) repeat protein
VVAKTELLSGSRSAKNAESSTNAAGRQSREFACSFAGFRLEADGTLWRGEAVVHLPPKELAALRALLAHAGQVVSPAQLKHELWGNVHVTADSVPKCLSSLRARLDPDVCIQTVYKRGYRFSAEIKREGAAPAGRPLRLAILPFATGYSVPEHLGPAMAEETTTSLSRARQFAVAVLARDSVFNLAQRGLTAQQIGQELKADLVLTGTLQAFSSHYRLRAEMIRIEDGTQIWVEDLLSSRSGTGALESDLMHRLAYRLGIGVPDDSSWSTGWEAEAFGNSALSPEKNNGSLEISAAAAGKIDDEHSPRQKEAYDIFLRGHYEWQTLHRHRMQDGLQRLLQAIELDPTLIFAKVDLANLCVAQALYGFMSPDASAEIVHRMAESIPDLPQSAQALLPALGWVNFHFDRNLPAALLAFSFSAHLPHDPWTTRARALFALSRNRFSEAAEMLRAAIRIDPFSPWLQSRLAWALHLDGQQTESLEQIHKCLSLFPNGDGASLYGAAILAFNGETAQACEIARSLEQRLPHFDLATAVHAYALACSGRADEARVVLERLQWLGRERYIVRGFTPAAYVALGDHEAALAELRAADEARCPWFFQALADPRLKPLHGNPEFERMRAILPVMEAEVEQDLEMES